MKWVNVRATPTSDLVRLIASAVLLRESDVVGRSVIALLDEACDELNARIPAREVKP